MLYQRKTKPATWTKAFPKQRHLKRPVGKYARAPRKPVSSMSRRMAEAKKEEARELRRFWKNPANARCILFPALPAEDHHHTWGRVNKLLSLSRVWVPVSRSAHDWIRDNPDLARAFGVLCPFGRYNSLPTEWEMQSQAYRLACLRWLATKNVALEDVAPMVSASLRAELFSEVKAAYNSPAYRTARKLAEAGSRKQSTLIKS